MNDPERNPAGFLGAELRRARVAAGYSSQEALAARLGYDRSVIAKAETGERPPSPEVADALEAELFPAGPSGFVGRLAALARRAGGPVPSWFESWLEAERDAHMLRLWSPVLVPGLLQTAGYARALFLATGLDEDAALEHVAVRLDRQAILERPRPPHVVAVLDQSVLDRLIGSPQVMADQLMHIAVGAAGRQCPGHPGGDGRERRAQRGVRPGQQRRRPRGGADGSRGGRHRGEQVAGP
jgi:transcriptional regulator with XRE-family HTH domain